LASRVEALYQQQRLDRRVRTHGRERTHTRNFGAGYQDIGAYAREFRGQRFDVGEGLVVLGEREHRKSPAHQRERPVPELGRAERLCMQAAGLLELERGFLRDAEAEAARHDIEAGRGTEALESRAPIELPCGSKPVRSFVQRPDGSS
jgi:hypothetical protein